MGLARYGHWPMDLARYGHWPLEFLGLKIAKYFVDICSDNFASEQGGARKILIGWLLLAIDHDREKAMREQGFNHICKLARLNNTTLLLVDS